MHKFIKVEQCQEAFSRLGTSWQQREVGGGGVRLWRDKSPRSDWSTIQALSLVDSQPHSWLLDTAVWLIKCFHCWLIVPIIIWLIGFRMAIVLFVACSTRTNLGRFDCSYDLDCCNLLFFCFLCCICCFLKRRLAAVKGQHCKCMLHCYKVTFLGPQHTVFWPPCTPLTLSTAFTL